MLIESGDAAAVVSRRAARPIADGHAVSPRDIAPYERRSAPTSPPRTRRDAEESATRACDQVYARRAPYKSADIDAMPTSAADYFRLLSPFYASHGIAVTRR